MFEPHASIVIKRVNKPPEPWFTYNIKEMMHLRDKALNKYKNTKKAFVVPKSSRNSLENISILTKVTPGIPATLNNINEVIIIITILFHNN